MLVSILNGIDRIFQTLSDPLLLLGRLILAAFFLPAGYDKIMNYAGTVSLMESHGIPGFLLPLVILTEVGGSLFMAFGFLTRITSLGLGIFTIMANYIFNRGGTDEIHQIVYMAEYTIVAAFLAYMAVGAGRWSIDAFRGRT